MFSSRPAFAKIEPSKLAKSLEGLYIRDLHDGLDVCAEPGFQQISESVGLEQSKAIHLRCT